MDTIGKRIRELRKEHELTQPDLARKIGVANSVISFWENDINYPRGDYVVKLADIFNTTTDYLLGRENDFGVKENGEHLRHYTQDEQQLISAYRAMSVGKRKALFDMLDIEKDR